MIMPLDVVVQHLYLEINMNEIYKVELVVKVVKGRKMWVSRAYKISPM